MKIRLGTQTDCPTPLFIIETENDADMLLMKAFITFPHYAKDDWKFHMHSYGGGGSSRSFTFGWAKKDGNINTTDKDEK